MLNTFYERSYNLLNYYSTNYRLLNKEKMEMQNEINFLKSLVVYSYKESPERQE